jgi:hypothetical protein
MIEVSSFWNNENSYFIESAVLSQDPTIDISHLTNINATILPAQNNSI